MLNRLTGYITCQQYQTLVDKLAQIVTRLVLSKICQCLRDIYIFLD